LFIAFCLWANLFGCTNAYTPKPATAAELSQMNRDFAKALNAKDAVAAANCYTEDATIIVERGKYTELLKRGADGKWLSTHGMWNTDTLALR
jgi:hypothetical protein